MVAVSSPISTKFKPPHETDLRRTLLPLRHGAGDPSVRIDQLGFWRTTRTPTGPATTLIAREGEYIRVTAWGKGAEWALEAAPELVGCTQGSRPFVPEHEVLRHLHRRMPGVRTPRSRAVVEALVPLIIEQKVIGAEARRAYRRLVRKWGEPAPGPADLMLPVAPEVLARIPYYAFHPLGIERRRADTVRRSCACAPRLEAAADLPSLEGQRRLMIVEGVGRWTACEVARVAFGDPDAVPLGDYHLPHLVSWVLTGEPRGSDARMLELLEPYRGQRGRALRLIELSGMQPPRRGPRMEMRAIQRH